MNLSCKVIQDLIPLYQDGICSEESKALVEEHLAQCENCRALLKKMGASLDIRVSKDEQEEEKALRRLSVQWNRQLFLSMVKGFFVALGFLILLLFLINLFIGIKIG